jgi:hypothetical protein
LANATVGVLAGLVALRLACWLVTGGDKKKACGITSAQFAP